MRITLNGEPREMADGHSVASLLADLGIPAERVAVELNLKVVDRQTFPGTPLREGDRVEVIGFIGGGGDMAGGYRRRRGLERTLLRATAVLIFVFVVVTAASTYIR